VSQTIKRIGEGDSIEMREHDLRCEIAEIERKIANAKSSAASWEREKQWALDQLNELIQTTCE
jgi:hypothetical protein